MAGFFRVFSQNVSGAFGSVGPGTMNRYKQEIQSYQFDTGSKNKPGLYTRTLLFARSMLDIPKESLANLLGASPKNGFVRRIVFNVIWANFIDPFRKLKHVLSVFTPKFFITVGRQIISFVTDCLWGGVKWVFSGIMKGITYIFDKIMGAIKKFTSLFKRQKVQKFLLEAQLDQKVGFFGKVKRAFLGLFKKVFSYAFKLFKWVYNKFESAFMKWVYPGCKCLSSKLKGLQSLAGGFLMYKTIGSVLFKKLAKMGIVKTSILNTTAVALAPAMGIVAHYWILITSAFGALGLLSMIASIGDVVQVKNTVYNLYKMSSTMNSMMGDLDKELGPTPKMDMYLNLNDIANIQEESIVKWVHT